MKHRSGAEVCWLSSPLSVSPTLIMLLSSSPVWYGVMYYSKRASNWMRRRFVLIVIIICLLFIKFPASIVCRTGFWDRKRHSVGDDFMWVPRVLLCMPWAEQPSWGFQGKTWVGCWVNRSSTCALWLWSYSRLSAASERSVAEYLEQCLRSRVRMHWKRWKQLLIFVSSARGRGGCSVQSWGEHVFIIICHPSAKKWIFFQDFYFCCLI